MTWGVSVESGGCPPIPFDGNDEGNSHPLIYLKVVTHLTFPVHYHEEMNATIISQNEIGFVTFLSASHEFVDNQNTNQYY